MRFRTEGNAVDTLIGLEGEVMTPEGRVCGEGPREPGLTGGNTANASPEFQHPQVPGRQVVTWSNGQRAPEGRTRGGRVAIFRSEYPQVVQRREECQIDLSGEGQVVSSRFSVAKQAGSPGGVE